MPSKARSLGKAVSSGNPLATGVINASDITGLNANALSDVDTITQAPQNNQALVWSSGVSNWVPGTINSGVTSVNGLAGAVTGLATVDSPIFTGNVGIGTSPPSVSLDISSKTDGLALPVGTTAQRPSTPPTGTTRFNTTITALESWTGSSWVYAIINNGVTASTAFRSSSDFSNQTVSGNYYIQTASMTSAQQYYVDYSTTGGPWVRIWLATSDNYNTTSYSWDNSQSSLLLQNCAWFMYAFCNTSNNSLTTPWAFRFADSVTLNGSSNSNKSSFFNTPPMGHGGDSAPLITQVYTWRLADNTNYTSYLRTGYSSFGSNCDDSRAGTWGQICLKAGNTASTNTGGYSDFPHYSSFAYSGTDNWARSDQAYGTNAVTSSYRFAVYCKVL